MSPSPSTDEAIQPSPSLRNPASPASVPRSALFLQPETPAPDPASLPTPPSPNSPSPSFSKESPTADPRPGPATGSWSSDSGAPDSGSPRRESSAAPSTGDDKPAAPVTRATLRAVLAEGVVTATGMLSSFVTAGPEKDLGLWRADDEDAAAIAGPASRLLWRRVPADARDSDTLDLISLAFGLGAYVAKNFKLKSLIQRKIAAGQIVVEPTTEGA